MFPQLILDEKAITPNDMTAVICVRLHENNPWYSTGSVNWRDITTPALPY